MSHTHCLNCNTELVSHYCHHCGQKGATHRITPKHFIMHDLLHGIWHFEKGILFTLRETFLRPGYMAINYIKGKRISYYNFFYLLLLVLGSNVLVSHLFVSLYDIHEPAPVKEVIDSDSIDVTAFVSNNFKLLLFLLIPFFALNSLIMFRRLKLNIAEHSIIAGTVLLCGAAWYFIFNLHYYLVYFSTWKLFDITQAILLFIVFLVPLQVYRQATGKHYKLFGYSRRILTWYLLLLIEVLMIIGIIALIKGKTGIVIN